MAKQNGKRKKRTWPVIRQIDGKTATVWELDTGSRVSPRVRKRFETEGHALAEAEKIRAEYRKHGLSAFEITVTQREDARQALAILQGTETSLTEAARFYASHRMPGGGDRTVREVWFELREYKERMQRKRPRYLADLRTKLAAFVQTFGDRDIKSVSASEIEEWLYGDHTIGEVTRGNTYRYLSVFFSFAQGKRDRRHPTVAPYRVDHPMIAVTRPTHDAKMPTILTVMEAKTLINAAVEHDKYDLLPYVALGLFCGIRAAELERLDWKHVNLAKGQVTISSEIAKKRRIRNIPIPKKAVTWLLPYAKKAGPLAPINCTARFHRFVRAAGFEKWPINAMRHSFGSYFYALRDDAPATAARLGHQGDAMLFDHYRALADKEDAEAYFAIVAPWAEKIEAFKGRVAGNA